MTETIPVNNIEQSPTLSEILDSVPGIYFGDREADGPAPRAPRGGSPAGSDLISTWRPFMTMFIHIDPRSLRDPGICYLIILRERPAWQGSMERFFAQGPFGDDITIEAPRFDAIYRGK
ncbi:hypothetical protein DTO164E3_8919 [Paecilomyces variotii]|nr:hypothetical protein DTO164E3_8919 [Paecilomyces variotii]KAJ9195824.1 hypothetical protein DTO032I3_6659 [Paecilomyces variotii]KAJ9276154.1 hypothetical protein DTO021D3_6922 [Paecilomyces variotii]KAJ9340792.1 hypothetical protein DTO027B6_6599 [Paecilomyces variotii]KAJ9392222.1 hypothetical protein DTO032I4_636 [Paecilomyces variotii]